MDVRTPAGRVHLIAVHPRPPIGDVAGWRVDQGVIRHAARATVRPHDGRRRPQRDMDHVPMRTLVGIGFEDAATQADSRLAADLAGRGRGVPARVRGAVAGGDRPRAAQLRAARAADRVTSPSRAPTTARSSRPSRCEPRRPLAWRPTAEDEAFCDVYGDWEPLTPAELRDLMAGFPAPWWVVGGCAVEAFTG